MTSPTIVPNAYTNTTADYRNSKINRTGAVTIERNEITVASGTTNTQYVGLIPFRKGFRFSYTSRIYVGTLTGATVNVGYIYRDAGSTAFDGTTLADNLTAYASGSAINGQVVFNNTPGADVWMKADGWIVIQVTATTSAAGNVSAELVFNYDQI